MRRNYHDAAKRRRLGRIVSLETSREALAKRTGIESVLWPGPGRQAAFAKGSRSCLGELEQGCEIFPLNSKARTQLWPKLTPELSRTAAGE